MAQGRIWETFITLPKFTERPPNPAVKQNLLTLTHFQLQAQLFKGRITLSSAQVTIRQF